MVQTKDGATLFSTMRCLSKTDFLFKGHNYAVILNLVYQRD
jgi:hypothetical protein